MLPSVLACGNVSFTLTVVCCGELSVCITEKKGLQGYIQLVCALVQRQTSRMVEKESEKV